jgi:hypothetical protein
LQKIQIEGKQIVTALGWLMPRTYGIAAIFIILATYSFHLILIFIHFHVKIHWLSLIADEHEPLFMSLVSDLFPNQVLEKTAYPELEAAIEQQVEESGLVYHPPWVLKLIQVGIMKY